MIIVSSCLLGLKCRYDACSKEYSEVISYLKDKSYLPVCPEQMGGLSTPRQPAEIKSLSPLLIENDHGEDVTEAFQLGSDEVVKLIKLHDVELAILKSKSPSCGSNQIYDGSFTRTLVAGEGLLSKTLRNKGIKVINEEEILKEKG